MREVTDIKNLDSTTRYVAYVRSMTSYNNIVFDRDLIDSPIIPLKIKFSIFQNMEWAML